MAGRAVDDFLAQGEGNLPGRRPIRRVPGKHGGQQRRPDGGEFFGDVRVVEQPRDGGLDGRTGVRHLSGQPFEQHQSEGIYIAERPGRFTGGLLRAQVRGRPGGSGVVAHGSVARHHGNTEVAELGPGAPVVVAVVDQQDIGRLYVAVHNPVMMNVGESVRQIVADQGHVRRGERPLGGTVAQVRSADQFHHEVGEARLRVAEVRAGVEQRHQGVVAHPREDADLLPLPAGMFKIIRVVPEEFDGHFPLQEFVMGPVHGGLASRADEGFDPVAAAQQEAWFHAEFSVVVSQRVFVVP